MSEKLADSRKESAAEKAKRLKEVCSQCAYWTSENSSYGTCDYIGYEGHQRPWAMKGIRDHAPALNA